jgi:hypothetical protein
MPSSPALPSHAHRADQKQPFSTDDVSAIRLLTLPDVGPPFDDDPAAKAIAGTIAAAATAGPGTKWAATGAGAVDPRQEVAAARVADSASREADHGGADHGGADAEWARQFALLLTEALSGARPVRQILPWTSDRARIHLRALMPLFGSGQRPRVLRVIATRPTRDVIEMTVIAGVGTRTRALAVRLERAGPADRTARLNQAAYREQPRLSPLAAQATRLGNTAADATPRWLCTDIEAA